MSQKLTFEEKFGVSISGTANSFSNCAIKLNNLEIYIKCESVQKRNINHQHLDLVFIQRPQALEILKAVKNESQK